MGCHISYESFVEQLSDFNFLSVFLSPPGELVVTVVRDRMGSNDQREDEESYEKIYEEKLSKS